MGHCAKIFGPVAFKAPFGFNSTAVLPKNVRGLTVAGVASSVTSKFNDTGAIVGLGNDLNRNVTWQDLIDGEDDISKKSMYQAYLTVNGKDLNSTIGSTTGLVNVAAKCCRSNYFHGGI